MGPLLGIIGAAFLIAVVICIFIAMTYKPKSNTDYKPDFAKQDAEVLALLAEEEADEDDDDEDDEEEY